MTAKRILPLLALLLAGGIITTGYSGEADIRIVPSAKKAEEPLSQPATGAATSTSASAPAEPDFKGIAAKMNLTENRLRKLVELARRNPNLQTDLLRSYPDLAAALAPAPAPAAKSASVKELLERQKKRDEADALVKRLADAKPAELDGIENSLAQIGPTAMLPLKLAEISENFELRQRASRIAGRLRWRLACPEPLLKAQPALVDVMSGSDNPARAALVDKVIAGADQNVLGFLGECLADSQLYIRQQALEGLVAVYEGDRVPEAARERVRQDSRRLMEIALGDENRNIRLLAISAMTKTHSVSIQRMSELLGDESMEVRATAIKAMGFSGDASAAGFLAPLLNDPQWRIRAAALEALGKVERSERGGGVAPRVAAMLEDEDAYVRAIAARLIGGWKYARAAPRLMQLVRQGKLSEDAAFTAMGEMEYAPGMAELVSRYDKAKGQLPRRAELLGLMMNYYKDRRVDQFLREAIADKSMRGYWPQIIAMMNRRNDATQFVPLVVGLLENKDPDQWKAAWAAWEMVREHVTEVRLPADLVARGMASTQGPLAGWVLWAEYCYNEKDFNKTLMLGLRHAQPEVAAMAMGLVAGDYFGDTMQQAAPPKSDRRRPEGSPDYEDPDTLKPRGKLAPEVVDELRSALNRKEPAVRLLAAAILYRSGADASEPVAGALRAGLAQNDAALRLIAMAGITENPKPFLDRYDVSADAGNPEMLHRAIEIMGNSRDAKFTPRLIVLAKDVTYENDPNLFRALMLSGDDKALAVVMDKLQRAQSYEIERFANSLRGAPGPGPVKFLAWDIKRQKEPYEKVSLLKILVTLPDPSAKPLIRQMLKDPSIVNEGNTAEIVVGLAQNDPAEGMPLLRKMLESGDEKQDSAISAITQAGVKPSREMTTMLLAAAKKSGGPAWESVAAWLPGESIREQFLPALAELNSTLQQGVIERTAGQLSAKDLDILLKLAPARMGARQSVAALVGALTSREDVRPALDKLPDRALVTILDAAGDWRDAPAAVEPYLKDKRPQVAAAARRGLALFLLGNPQSPSTPAHREILLEALQSKDDPAGAYLASEALAQRWPKEFVAVEPAWIPSSTAKLRLAVAMGKNVTPALREKVASALADAETGKTALELAVVSAIQSYDASYKVVGEQLAGRVEGDLLLRAIAASGETQRPLAVGFNEPPSAWEPRSAWDRLPGGRALTEKVVAQARAGDGTLFRDLATIGWIDKPGQGDLLRYINATASMDHHGGLMGALGLKNESDGQSYDPTSGITELKVALRWAAPEPDQGIVNLISSDKTPGVLAAAVAAVQWNLPAGREALLRVIVSKKSSGTFRQSLAVRALGLCAKPEDAKTLVAAINAIDPEKYQLQGIRNGLIRALANAAPLEAIKLLQAAKPEDLRNFNNGNAPLTPADLTIFFAGQEGWPDKFSVIDDSRREEAPPILSALKASQSADTPPATSLPSNPPPVPKSLSVEYISQSPSVGLLPNEEIAKLALLPPWGLEDSRHPSRATIASNMNFANETTVVEINAVRKAAARSESQAPQNSGDPVRSIQRGRYYGGGRFARWSSPDSPETPTRHDQFLAGEAEEHYTTPAGSGELFQARIYLDDEAIAKNVRPLLDDSSAHVRIAGMRLAAYWQVDSLYGRIAKSLSAPGPECIEAAWALVALRDSQAAQTIAAAWKEQKDFDLRVRLACVLRTIGSDAGLADIERAISLRAIRQLRLRFIDADARQRGEGWSPYEGSPAASNASVRAVLVPWESALNLAAPDLLTKDARRFPVGRLTAASANLKTSGGAHNDADKQADANVGLPVGAVEPSKGESGVSQTSVDKTSTSGSAGTSQPTTTASPPALDLSGLYIADDGWLAAPLGAGNGLPIQPLATAPNAALDPANSFNAAHTDLFSRLCVAEQGLEPYFFVQFADQSKDLQDLKAKWSAWWLANKGKGPEQWWRQAAEQAVEELTHADWWQRMRAARRLTRLTGQAVIPPRVFDKSGWKALQAAWRQKLRGDSSSPHVVGGGHPWPPPPDAAARDGHRATSPATQASSSPRLWLLAAGVRAGVLPAGAEAHATDDAAYLADLVKLAGFAPDALAEAAMLQMQQHAPRDAILKLANSWKHSPRRALAYWIWYQSRQVSPETSSEDPGINVRVSDDSKINVNVPPGGE
jgi:HEAT repeat protein